MNFRICGEGSFKNTTEFLWWMMKKKETSNILLQSSVKTSKQTETNLIIK